jgi:hypothetical protein
LLIFYKAEIAIKIRPSCSADFLELLRAFGGMVDG